MISSKWYKARGFRFIFQRGANLLNRYGISPAMAIGRLEHCVEALAGQGCAPTFPTPGAIVQHHPQFIHRLQDAGAEIAVHGHYHVDLHAMPVPVARQQLERAVQTFERFGIEARGFRCPYLGWSKELRDALPAGMFDYSSNEAICCEPDSLEAGSKNGFYGALRRFYQSKLFSERVCLPSIYPNLIEIPVCVPDDLQLHDGLELGPEGIGEVWGKMLDQIYERGELLTLMFHPELASFCESPFTSLLVRASQFPLPVWLARLRDVSDWWREKSGFRVESCESPTGLRLAFTCSPRATILVRGLGPCESAQVWEGAYHRLQSRTVDVPAEPRPFVGLPASAPGRVASFLREQGYLLDTSETATRCAIYLDTGTINELSEVQLVDRIEAAPGPLVRYWRWPAGAKSALCLTGDLDALTLLDYVGRLFDR